MGVVYRARQTTTGRIVALKLLRSEHLQSAERLARFRAEIDAVARLDHPNVLPFWEAGEHEGQPFYTMRWVEAGSLADQTSRWTLATAEPAGLKAREREVATLMRTLAQAVHHAHERGVLHRDLKPGNVLIDTTGHPYVADFGLAKFVQEDPVWVRSAQPLTQAGVGSPGYMAPEQAGAGGRAVTTAADVYSLGAILYELLAGRRALGSGNTLELLDKLRNDDPAPPSTHFRSVDPDLETICLKCLRREPTERYSSVSALADDLDRWLRDEPILARPITDWERAVRWVRRRPALSALAASLILAVVIGTTIILGLLRETQQALASEKKAFNLLGVQDVRIAHYQLDGGEARPALVQLARLSRGAPDYPPAKPLLLSVLQEHNFAWPVAGPFDNSVEVSRVSFSFDGRYLITAGSDGVARIWPTFDQAADPGAPLASGQPLALSHGSWVWCAVFNIEGTRVATSGNGTDAKIWEFPSGRLLQAIEHKDTVRSVSFSPDGKYVVTASLDKIGRVSETDTGAKVVDLVGHTNGLIGAAFSPDGRSVFTVADDVRIWDWRTGQPACPPIKLENGNGVSAVSLSAQGDRLVLGTTKGEVSVWEFPAGRRLFELPRHQRMIATAEFSVDGCRLLTAEYDYFGGIARVWDGHDGKPLSPELEHRRALTDAHFSPDGLYLATASQDGLVRVWDALTYETWCEPIDTGQFSFSLAFAPDGHRIATSSGKGIAAVWDLRPGKAMPIELSEAPGPLSSCLFQSDARVVAASRDGTVRLLDASDGRLLSVWPHTNEVVKCFTPDGNTFATMSTNGVGRVWSAQTGAALSPPLVHPQPVDASVFDRAGQRLFVCTIADPIGLFLWEVSSGRLVASGSIQRTNFGLGVTQIRKAVFTPDEQAIVMGSYDGRVLLWEFSQGAPGRTFLSHEALVQDVCFSPDGRRLATASFDRTARLVEWPTGRSLSQEPMSHQGEVVSARFSADGLKLVTTSFDHTARVWDGLTGRLLLPPLVHGDRVLSARFSPDGDRLAAASWDNTACVWDLASGRLVLFPLKHPHWVDRVQFSDDGHRLLTLYRGGPPFLWDVPAPSERLPAVVVELAEAIAGERLDYQGMNARVPLRNWVQLTRSIAASTNTDVASRWARWFVSDRGDRTISFLSGVKVSDFVEARLQEDTLESLQAAARLAPTNGLVLARLTRKFLQQSPETRPYRLAEADAWSVRALDFGESLPEVQAVRAQVEAELARAGLPTVHVPRAPRRPSQE